MFGGLTSQVSKEEQIATVMLKSAFPHSCPYLNVAYDGPHRNGTLTCVSRRIMAQERRLSSKDQVHARIQLDHYRRRCPIARAHMSSSVRALPMHLTTFVFLEREDRRSPLHWN